MKNLAGFDATRDGLSRQLRAWSGGFDLEVNFWTDWIRTKGGEWPEDFGRRLTLDDEWPPENTPAPQAHWKILDVGAGPITRLWKSVGRRPLDITAVDPLGAIYADLWASTDIEPPICTQPGFAEDLTALFEPESFDMTCMQNALDHSFDPIRAVEEMLLVTKVDGIVVLTHATDEAERERYRGFHQWNLNAENDRFVVWNKESKTIVDPLFSDVGDFKTQVSGEIVRTVIRKTRSMSIDIGQRRKERLQAVLSSFVSGGLVSLDNLSNEQATRSRSEASSAEAAGLFSSFWSKRKAR